MYENPAVVSNIEFLKNKVDFISPKFIEGKAKAAEPEEILDVILGRFGSSPVLKGKKVLITAGPTIEYIDPVRVITNQSSGKTGVLLASEFVSAGSKVTMIYGPGTEMPPKGAKVVHVKTSEQMSEALKKEMRQKWDIVILAAAVSDYSPEKPSKTKIDSNLSRISLKMKKVPKMINSIKKIQKDVFLVGFKAETGISKEQLIKKAREKITQADCDLVIANDIGTKRYKENSGYNNVISVDLKHTTESGWKEKSKVAKFIRKEIEKRIR